VIESDDFRDFSCSFSLNEKEWNALLREDLRVIYNILSICPNYYIP